MSAVRLNGTKRAHIEPVPDRPLFSFSLSTPSLVEPHPLAICGGLKREERNSAQTFRELPDGRKRKGTDWPDQVQADNIGHTGAT